MDASVLNIASVGRVGNPLDDTSLMDALFTFFQSLVVAAVPFLILAFVVAGLYFIVARGSSSGIQDARSFFFKLLIVAAGVLGFTFFVTLIINFIKSLYNAI